MGDQEDFFKKFGKLFKEFEKEKIVKIIKERNEIILSFVMFTAYLVVLVHYMGLKLGLTTGIVSGYFGYQYWKILTKQTEKNESRKTGTITKAKVVKYIIILFLFYVVYINFNGYCMNPEITITSPRSGDVVKIDKDNTFLKISGTSKGLTNNQFLHLFILYRRIDSNQASGEWYFDDELLNPCAVYNDGSWECRIQLHELYAEWINETLTVKSPINSSNNISTNVDIVAIITKQPIKHSIFTKLRTRIYEVSDVYGPAWYKTIIFLLPTGKGTFYDPDYDTFDFEYDGWYYYRWHYLPKHLADDHVTVTPLITEPFNLTGSPHGLQVCVYPWAIPADNVTSASLEVQLIDNVGNYVHSEGRILNITCTRGNLSTDHIITNSQGRGTAYVTSGELGEGLILVQSYRLNNGTCQITYTLPPVISEFNQWVMSSPEDNETSELTANFQTMHDAEYSVALTGWGTEAHWPLKPEGWPIVRVEVDGTILRDIEVNSDSSIELPIGNVYLNAGDHTLRVTITNDFAVPLVGERNLYVVRVEFS